MTAIPEAPFFSGHITSASLACLSNLNSVLSEWVRVWRLKTYLSPSYIMPREIRVLSSIHFRAYWHTPNYNGCPHAKICVGDGSSPNAHFLETDVHNNNIEATCRNRLRHAASKWTLALDCDDIYQLICSLPRFTHKVQTYDAEFFG